MRGKSVQQEGRSSAAARSRDSMQQLGKLLKDAQLHEHDLVSTLKDHLGNHVEDGLEVLRENSEGVDTAGQVGGMRPGLKQQGRNEETDVPMGKNWGGGEENWVLLPAFVQYPSLT